MCASRRIASILTLGLMLAAGTRAQTVLSVGSASDLVNAITAVDNNASTPFVINFTGSITLGAANTLPAILTASSVTINGQNHTLDGGGGQRGFTVSSGTVTIENLTIQNALAEGGAGGNGGGGGGAGLGGALFVSAPVTLLNDVFGTSGNPNRASGGTGGGSGSGGGGGGIGGNGGGGTATGGGGGGGVGGGFMTLDANGGRAPGGSGDPGIALGAGSAGSGSGGGSGGGNGGGGGAGGTGNSNGGGGGGFGTGTGATGGNGGQGGFGGGGGGGGSGSSAGNGGFGGGGGGGGAGGSGGNGGFGGGGYFGGGFGAFGGGSGGSAGAPGGGGAGAGGAIFVAPGGSVVVAGSLSILGNAVAGGAAGGFGVGPGTALGSGVFLSGSDKNNGGGGQLSFSPPAGQTVAIADVIADQTGSGGAGADAGSWGLTLNGPGTLQLSGANTFSGGVTVNGGTLQVNTPSGSGTGPGSVSVNRGGTLSGTGTLAGSVFVNSGGTIAGAAAGTVTINGNVTFEAGSTFTPGFSPLGGGTLQIAGSVNWFGGAVANFNLGTAPGVSDEISLPTGVLGKQGSGAFLFNFLNTGTAGQTYTLASFASTTFNAGDFTYTGLSAGLTGTFSVSGGALEFTVTGAPPAITSPASASGITGTPFTYTITATGSPTSFSATGGLPVGLNVDTSTGIISGTPTQTGASIVSIAATNSNGTGTQALTIDIAAPLPPPSITSAPNAGGAVGSGFSYTITATNSPTRFTVSGALPAGLSLNQTTGVIFGTPTQVGAVTVTVGAANSTGAAMEAVAFAIGAANPLLPSIKLQPISQTVAPATTVVFSVTASGSPSYQWQLNGQSIFEATSARLVLSGATAANAGSYICLVTNAAGSTATVPAILAITAGANPGRLINLSVNTTAGRGQVLTVGFVSGGSGTTGSENLLIRATGPALAAFGVPNTLADPTLNVLNSSGPVVSNDNWGTPLANQNAVMAADIATGAFPLTNPGSLDAALATALPAAAYTVQISGNTAAVGTTLAEVYDNTPAASYTPATPRLINISSNNQIAGQGSMTAGFVVGGTTSKTVLIRATGPALAVLGLDGTMPDPQLAVHTTVAGQDTVLASNAGWGGDPQITAADAAVGAFPLTNPASADSVVLMTLAPGAYTALASSVSGTAGIVLIEVYEVP